MITYKQYMSDSSTASHHAYFAQFVTPAVVAAVKEAFSIDALRHDFAIADARGDSAKRIYKLKAWDDLAIPGWGNICEAIRATGNCPAPADKVCVAKTAARMWLKGEV